MTKTNYWFDTEFMEDGTTIDLISIGMICEDGRELYCEVGGLDWTKANPFVREHVIPNLWSQQDDKSEANGWLTHHENHWGGLMSGASVAREVRNFVDSGEHPARFWAYYADYDWVVLAQLYGRMVDMPANWPKFCMDIKQLAVHLGDPDLPAKIGTEHNALDDAKWNKVAWDWLLQEADRIDQRIQI